MKNLIIIILSSVLFFCSCNNKNSISGTIITALTPVSTFEDSLLEVGLNHLDDLREADFEYFPSTGNKQYKWGVQLPILTSMMIRRNMSKLIDTTNVITSMGFHYDKQEDRLEWSVSLRGSKRELIDLISSDLSKKQCLKFFAAKNIDSLELNVTTRVAKKQAAWAEWEKHVAEHGKVYAEWKTKEYGTTAYNQLWNQMEVIEVKKDKALKYYYSLPE